ASLTGRRGSRFALQLTGDVAPERIAVAARGDYAGRQIVMPRRAVLLKTPDGGWGLPQTQLSFGDGFAIAEGRFSGTEPAQGRVRQPHPFRSCAVVAADRRGTRRAVVARQPAGTRRAAGGRPDAGPLAGPHRQPGRERGACGPAVCRQPFRPASL